MYNARIVGSSQSARNVDAAIAGFARPHWAAAQALPQCLSLEQLGHDIRTPIVLADVED
jgi:hypothetical protein